jgi:hypothetical protein
MIEVPYVVWIGELAIDALNWFASNMFAEGISVPIRFISFPIDTPGGNAEVRYGLLRSISSVFCPDMAESNPELCWSIGPKGPECDGNLVLILRLFTFDDPLLVEPSFAWPGISSMVESMPAVTAGSNWKFAISGEVPLKSIISTMDALRIESTCTLLVAVGFSNGTGILRLLISFAFWLTMSSSVWAPGRVVVPGPAMSIICELFSCTPPPYCCILSERLYGLG